MTQEFIEKVQSLDAESYQAIKRALELGKWPNEERLTPEQQEVCMQAVIGYEAKHLPENERTGFMGQACPSTGFAANMISSDREQGE